MKTYFPYRSIIWPDNWVTRQDFRGSEKECRRDALWVRTAMNRDGSPFAQSLAPLTRLLALPCSLCLHAPLRSLICSLAHFTHSHACGTVNNQMTIFSVFFSILSHSAQTEKKLSTRKERQGKRQERRQKGKNKGWVRVARGKEVRRGQGMCHTDRHKEKWGERNALCKQRVTNYLKMFEQIYSFNSIKHKIEIILLCTIATKGRKRQLGKDVVVMNDIFNPIIFSFASYLKKKSNELRPLVNAWHSLQILFTHFIPVSARNFE